MQQAMITALLGLQHDEAWTGRTAREVPTVRPAMDPLVADTLYNTLYSPLCGLPEELLLQIIYQLDPIGLQCLRRTSRLFLRLFSDGQFDRYHALSSPATIALKLPGPPLFSPWAQPSPGLEHTDSWTPGSTSLHQLLRRDMAGSVCPACAENKEAREAWHATLRVRGEADTSSRHCVPCGSRHPLVFFSRLRQCIGRRGYVRLCEHPNCVITWDTAVQYGRQLARLDVSEPARIRLLVCRDKSHLPAHHPRRYTNADEQGYYPSITIIGSQSIAIRLCMEWKGHLQLTSPRRAREDERMESRLTPTDMVRLLKRFRRGTPAEFIVPQSGPGCALPEMRCLDPNRCECLDYKGWEDVPRGWPLALRQSKRSRNQACRFSTKNGCGADGNVATINMKIGTHTARSVHISGGRGDSERRIDIDACPTAIMSSPSPPCVVITYRRWILVAAEGEECRAVTQSWYEAIDPRSYAGVLLSGDDRSVPFDVLACPGDDRACANYYCYGERPVMKGYGESPRVYEKLIRSSRCGWHHDISEKDKRTGNVGEAPLVCQPPDTNEGNTTILRVVFVFVLVGLLFHGILWWQN